MLNVYRMTEFRQVRSSSCFHLNMSLYVGTSGYAYKEWIGKFYPEDLPVAQMLKFYGERFRSVEKSTKHILPHAESLDIGGLVKPGSR